MREIFENQQIDLEALPQYQDVTFTRLPARAAFLRLISGWFTLFIIFSVLTVLPQVEPDIQILPQGPIGTMAYSIFVVLWTLWTVYAHAQKGYAVREHDILYKEGVIHRVITILPVNRVQHIEFHRSFLERRLGLSSLYLYSAGGSSADMGIRGLPVEEAEAWRGWLLERIQNQQFD